MKCPCFASATVVIGLLLGLLFVSILAKAASPKVRSLLEAGEDPCLGYLSHLDKLCHMKSTSISSSYKKHIENGGAHKNRIVLVTADGSTENRVLFLWNR